MVYTVENFKSKKALIEKVKTTINGKPAYQVRCYQPGLGSDLSNYTGKITLEGPHYPKPHTWYAEAELVNGVVVKVK